MAKNLLGMARGYTGGGRVPPYQYRGGGRVGNTDTVPAMLTPGEVVLNAGQQQRLGAAAGVPSGALFGAAGVPGFQGGGMVPEFEVAEPVSTAHNAMDNLMMQNEMNRIAQENQQYGAMRNIVPMIEGPGGLGMLEWAGGPLKGMGMLASNKTVSRMIKDLVMANARRGSRFTPDEIPLRLADRINTDKSLIEALRNWQKLNKKVPKD